MSQDKFNDDCPGCRPALIDLQTGRPMAADTPIMQAVNKVWESTTLPEREAFHRVCCLNSRAPADLEVMQALTQRIQQAASTASN